MSADSIAAVIVNDLDSLIHRIGALPYHPDHAPAVDFVKKAKLAVDHARKDLKKRAEAGSLSEKSR